jgi:hypothetical protein
MPKLVVAYTVFSLVLFGALFAAFFISGLGAPSQAWNEPAAPAVADPEPPPESIARTRNLDYPSLAVAQLYRVSHATPMFPEPAASRQSQETLPAGGYFTVESPMELGAQLWYRVRVTDGRNDFLRFILAEDLNFKRVAPIYSASEARERNRDAVLEMLRQTAIERRERQLAQAPPEPPVERQPESFGEWWAMTADRIGGARAATVTVSVVAAAIATAVTLGSIFLVISLRREMTWDRPGKHGIEDEPAEPEAEDASAQAEVAGTDPRW